MIAASLINDGEGGEKDNIYAKNDTKVEKYIKIEKQKDALRKALGRGSIYPEYYSSIKEDELAGKSRSAAEKEAEKAIVKREALYRYAVCHGYGISLKKTRAKMQKELNEMRSADGYGEYSKAYASAGLSFADEYMKDERLKQKTYSIDALYTAKTEKFRFDENAAADQKKSVDEQYEDFCSRVVGAYMRTVRYDILQQGLDRAEKNMRKYGHDAAKIKKTDVDVYDRI